MDLTQYRAKLIGSKDERAVSPVIGVILMVAITVILAAVIAAFVLDMGSGLNSSAQAGVATEGSESPTVKVTAESLSNADGVAIIDPGTGEPLKDGADGPQTDSGDNIISSIDNQVLTSSGQTATIEANTGVDGESYELNIVAYNGDKTDRSDESVITTVTVYTGDGSS